MSCLSGSQPSLQPNLNTLVVMSRAQIIDVGSMPGQAPAEAAPAMHQVRAVQDGLPSC